MLVALRTWAPRWAGRRFNLRVRSDSVSALTSLVRCRSAGDGTNSIACELALDLARSIYRPDVAEHVPGIANALPDALSRLSEPGAEQTVPLALRAATRARPAVRDSAFYKADGIFV